MDDTANKLLDLEAEIIENNKKIFALETVVAQLIRNMRANSVDIPQSLVFDITALQEAELIVGGQDTTILPTALAEFNERVAKLWNPPDR